MIRLQLDLIEYLNSSLAEMKKSRRERGFDDLLLDVHTALTDNPHAETPPAPLPKTGKSR